MTTSLLAFNIAATAYLVLGSGHEEARLREAFGHEYDHYRRSGVPFYIPLSYRSIPKLTAGQ
jgi:protein-S-isoprenylcysteine O-methyltransferase Ste14